MALLHSLQICGIRSFSPENNETIYFNTPVTLFLGQNGCGKTTIIESIRFALTSELPAGSSNGQGFLNDPKMSNKNSTKGAIRIKFVDCQGHEITVSRFMSVTAKAGGGLTFKKMMFNVRRRDKDDPANHQDISGRCIDIDSYCSNALNVSKSILNNVIFCHQENSAWPLDEPKKLKEKFDEIFDAVRYIKCVDTLRKYVKDKQSNIKVLQERLTNRKCVKEEVERRRGKFDEKKEKLSEVNGKIAEKNGESKPLEKRMQEILDLEVSLGGLEKQLTGKEAEKKGLVEQQNTIKERISYIFEGSDEELMKKIDSFEEEREAEEKIIGDLEKRKKDVMVRSADISSSVQKVQVKIGQLKEGQKQQSKRTEERRDLVQKARAKLQINNDTDLDSSEIIIIELQSALELQEELYENLVKEQDVLEKELQTQIDDVREKFVGTKQNIASKKGLIREYQAKTREINNKLDQLDTSDSQLRIVGDKIEKLQSTLAKLKGSFDETEKLHETEELKENIQGKEQILEKLDREYRLLQQNYVTEQKLDSEKSFIIEKQGEINRIRTKHAQNFRKLFGEDIPEKDFKKAILGLQNREEVKFKSLTDRINKLQKQVTTSEATIKHQQEKLLGYRKDLQANKKKVSDVCKGNPFREVLECSYDKKEKLQKDKGQYSSAKIMYEAFISKFEKESPCCPVCHTDFADKRSVVAGIVRELKAKIERIPNQLAQTEKDLKKEEEQYNKLQQLQPVNNEIEALTKTKIPELEAELRDQTEKLEDMSMELASEKNLILTPQSLIETCRNVITDAPLLDQYLADIRKAKAAVEELEGDIVKVASNRSRQETEAEIDNVKAELSNLKNQYDSNKRRLDQHRERIQQLNTNIQSETQKQIDMQKLVQEKPLLETQKTEYLAKLQTLTTEVDDLNDVVTALDKDLKEATQNRQSAVQANRRLKEEERSKMNACKNIVGEVQKLQNSIDLYVRNGEDGKLETAVEELAELKTKEEKLEEAKSKIVEAISVKKQNLAKQQSNFRALRDNETLREKQKLELKLVTDIDVLKKKIGDYNYKTVYNEKHRLAARIDKYRREIDGLTGQKEEIEKQLDEIEEELEKPQNKNAFNNYKKQYYELRVNQVAMQDLSDYVNVLEQSVLKFHQERMVQINRTIRELWRNIYRGNDIDYIEIQTDTSMTGGVNRRRTYNYKVVQVKKGVELEMRGRCSAGQKVLACLVIRMALAETFSSHCGILALDEPTTNLDRENILSLSDALSRIITVREKEKNFQLLIITHDEDFLNTLTRVQSLDSYWRVKRNEEGFSTVQRQLL